MEAEAAVKIAQIKAREAAKESQKRGEIEDDLAKLKRELGL